MLIHRRGVMAHLPRRSGACAPAHLRMPKALASTSVRAALFRIEPRPNLTELPWACRTGLLVYLACMGPSSMRVPTIVPGSRAATGAFRSLLPLHCARGMFVRRVMNATVAAIEARKDARRVLDLVPNQRLIWREATAQHFPALGGHWLHSFMLRSNIEQLDQRCAHHPLAEMIRHAHWNPAAEPLVRAAGVPVLRTWMASAKAWYAHTDHGDCTHFCQPGLLDGWAAQLLEMVSALVAQHRIG